jgi:hypothetical protein
VLKALRHNEVSELCNKVPNSINASLLDGLYAFMTTTGASESHCNNTLKTAIAFSHFLDPDQSFFNIGTRDKIIDFLAQQEYQEPIQLAEAELDEMKEFMGDVILNEIISRHSRNGNGNENCNVINDGLL